MLQGPVDDSDEPIHFREEKGINDMVLLLEVSKIKLAVDTMIKLLKRQGSLEIQRSSKIILEAKSEIKTKERFLNKKKTKKAGMNAELEPIVSDLLKVCEVALGESRYMGRTYKAILNTLADAREKLEKMYDTKYKGESTVTMVFQQVLKITPAVKTIIPMQFKQGNKNKKRQMRQFGRLKKN